LKIKLFNRSGFLPPEEKKERNKQRLLLMLSGIMMGLSFPPVPFPLLMFFGLIPYFYVIEKKDSLIDINRSTYLMAFFFSLFSVYWVGAWQVGKDPFLMIAGGLLMFINPVFFLIPSTLLYFARSVIGKKASLFLFPIFWVTYEYAYMLTDASFPWLTLGNGLSHFNLFIQIADVIGALGLSVIIVFINLFLFKAYNFYKTHRKLSYIYTTAAFILFAIPLVYGVFRISSFKLSENKVKIGLIQPDLDPYEKWAGGNLNDFAEEYFSLSKKAVNSGAEFLVWPETAFPVYLFSGNYPGTVGRIYDFLNKNNVQLLTGMPDIIYYRLGDEIPPDAKINKAGTFNYATYNSVILADPYSVELQRYGKMKLVPFGERVPFVDALPFLGSMIKWGVGLSGWNVGHDTSVFNVSIYKPVVKNQAAPFLAPVVPEKKMTFKVNGCVCYESIYPTFLAEFTRKGSQLIAVVTNDSWYGNSSGPYQHKEISVLRAIENRRSVIRAANGGISCYINPLGITESATKMYTKNYLVADVVLQNDMTFFAKHPFVIPVSASIFSLWIVGIYYLLKIKNRFSGNKKID